MPTATESPSTAKTTPGAAAQAMSESDFLAAQADQAMAAVKKAVGEMKEQLAQGANPVVWAKEYPWVAIGAAAAAGFLGTSLLVPSREEQALRKLAAIERALSPKPAPSENGNGKHDGKGEAPPASLGAMIVKELIGVIRPAIVSLITAGISAKAVQSERTDSAPQADPNGPSANSDVSAA